MDVNFEDMLGLNTDDMMETEKLVLDDETIDVNIEEIINQCKQGIFPDISEWGSVKCYEISPQYVLVERQIENAETAKKLKSISSELRYMGLNVHTVVDYRTDEEHCYELQTRAKGKIFKHRMLESDLEKEIEESRVELDREKAKRMLENNPSLKTRKDEYMRRCSMLMQMPKEHIIQYFDTIVSLSQFYRLGVDTVGEGNLLYDNETGFNFIDIGFFDKPSRHVSVHHLLDIDNTDTMTELIGMEYIDNIDEEDRSMVLQSIKDSLKKIICSVVDCRVGGEKITIETIKSGLESYRKYGINITLEEILATIKKEKNSVLQSGIETTASETKTEQPLIPDKSVRVLANDNEIATNKEDAIKIVSDLEQSQEMQKNKSEVSLNDE